MSGKSERPSITKNTIYMYIRMAISIIIGLYTSRLVLRFLGVEDYGIYNVVGGIVSLFIFLNNALSQATQRFLAFELGKNQYGVLQRTFAMCLNVHIIISILIVILAETIGLWLIYYKLNIPEFRLNTALYVYQFSIFAAVISITQVPYNASIFAHEKFNAYAMVSICDSIIRLLIAFMLSILNGDLLLYYGFFILCANVFQAIVYRIYCIKSFEECRYSFFWDKSMFKRIFTYTSWSLFGNLADTLADQGSNLLLNIFFGPAINASRGIALTVKASVAGFVYNFQSAANPQIVKRYAIGNIDSMISLVNKSSKISFFLFLLIMMPLCLEIDVVLQFWLGEVPPYLNSFTRLTLLTVLLQTIGGTLQSAIQASGRIKRYQVLVGGLKLFTIPICYIGLRCGCSPLWPFIVIMLIYGGVVYVNLFVVKRELDYPIMNYLRNVICVDFVVLFISVIPPFIILQLFPFCELRYLITIPISIISILLTSFFVGLNNSERTWFLTLVKSKLHL